MKGDRAAVIAKSFERRFMRKVQREASGCWVWTGRRQREGYGEVCVNYRSKRAHRISYELFVGPIPDGLHILHSCDNPSCVNPQHLRPGTDFENARDRVLRNRQPAGERNVHAKLSETDVRAIRARLVNGELQYQIASLFGVTKHAISKIHRGVQWKGLGL